tara:strand:+ start:7369 stop:8766 length:1398 start_codon:yes stop_codon:yes gene_type:complete
MDYNYQQLLAQANQQRIAQQSNINSTLSQALEDKKRDILLTSEGLSTPLIVEGGRGLLKRGFKKIKANADEAGDETTSGVVDELSAMNDDYAKGGLKAVLKGTKTRLQQRIKDKAQNKLRQQGQDNLGDSDETDNILAKGTKLFKSKVKDALGDFMEGKPQLDDDITRDLVKGGKTPSLQDYKDAVRKQINRNTSGKKKAGSGDDDGAGAGDGAEAGAGAGADDSLTKDSTTLGDNLEEDGTIRVKTFAKQITDRSKLKQKSSKSQRQQEASDKLEQQKSEYKQLSPESRAEYTKEYKSIRKTQQDRIANEDRLSDARLDLNDSLLEKYKAVDANSAQEASEREQASANQQQQQTKPQTDPEPDTPPEPKPPNNPDKPKPNEDGDGDGDGGGDGKLNFKERMEKSGEKMGEEEVEGGGPEDPFADIISLGTGLAGLLGGLFGSIHKKEGYVPQAPEQNVSVQVGQ